jgi:hypothetical protein
MIEKLRKKTKIGQILLDALDTINNGRKDQYGNPENSFVLIAELWNSWLKKKMIQKVDASDVAMMMTLFKIARESYQHKDDNILDACGYLGIYSDITHKQKGLTNERS